MYKPQTNEGIEEAAKSGCSCPACGECSVMYLGDVTESRTAKVLHVMLPWDNGS